MPILLVWVIATPVAALILLYKNINKGPDNSVNKYFLILYQGLKKKAFYWEFVNTLRKVLLVIILMAPGEMKILLSAFVIISSARVQMFIQPYRDTENNKIELYAIIASLVTLMSSLIFSQNDSIGYLDVLIVIVVFLLNVIFILEWTYKMLVSARSKHKVLKLVSDYRTFSGNIHHCISNLNNIAVFAV